MLLHAHARVFAPPIQTQAPKLEVDEVDGEDLVGGQLRQLQDALTDVQHRLDRAKRELDEAHFSEQK